MSISRGNPLPDFVIWIIAAVLSFWWLIFFGLQPTTDGGAWLLAVPFLLFPILFGFAFPERHSSRRASRFGGLSTGGASAATFLFMALSTGNRNDAETIVVLIYSLVTIPLAAALASLLVSFSSHRRLRGKGEADS